LKSAEIADLNIGEHQYRAAYERGRHTHERACFHFLFSGGYFEYLGGTTQECKTFSLCFQPQGYEHSYRGFPEPSNSFTIELGDSWVAKLRDYSVKLNQPGNFCGGSVSWLMAKLYREFHLMESASALVIEALTMELAVEASRCAQKRADDSSQPWLRQARELMNESFAEPLSLQHIAQAVGVHPVHLARVFRQHYQSTVGEYLRQLRVEFAGQQMAHSRSTLAEIALAAGFSDQSQFNKTFKRATGLTPAQFRAQVRGRCNTNECSGWTILRAAGVVGSCWWLECRGGLQLFLSTVATDSFRPLAH
jgi:AraC family transcriptional regulator